MFTNKSSLFYCPTPAPLSTAAYASARQVIGLCTRDLWTRVALRTLVFKATTSRLSVINLSAYIYVFYLLILSTVSNSSYIMLNTFSTLFTFVASISSMPLVLVSILRLSDGLVLYTSTTALTTLTMSSPFGTKGNHPVTCPLFRFWTTKILVASFLTVNIWSRGQK